LSDRAWNANRPAHVKFNRGVRFIPLPMFDKGFILAINE
jgi:hypothetical protein